MILSIDEKVWFWGGVKSIVNESIAKFKDDFVVSMNCLVKLMLCVTTCFANISAGGIYQMVDHQEYFKKAL